MPIEIIMPSLGAVAEESTLVRWLVSVGDTVSKGQPIFEAESDKATVEIEAPETGIVHQLMAAEGDVILAGTVVGLLLSPGEASAEQPRLAAEPPSPAAPSPPAQAALAAPRGIGGRVIASPLARKIANQRGVDLTVLRGTGPHGRILAADVKDALAAVPAAIRPPATSQPLPLTGVRAATARRMADSARTVAPVTLITEADASALVDLRQTLRVQAGNEGDLISYDLLMAMITAQALRQHPVLNASLAADGMVHHRDIHIGVAVDSEHGLFVPVLRSVPDRRMLDLAHDLNQKIQRVRDGRVRPDDMGGATFTITNLGVFGIDAFTPIINLPECAILGIGRIVEKPVVREGVLVAGRTIMLSLTFDHRVVDGGPAARFLQCVSSHIEKPGLMWLR